MLINHLRAFNQTFDLGVDDVALAIVRDLLDSAETLDILSGIVASIAGIEQS